MKSLIKPIIFFLAICTSYITYSQSFTFGVKGGVNFSNMLIEESEFYVPYNTSVADPKMKIGFHIGGVIEYPVTGFISIESGLFLTTLGTKLTTEEPFGGTTLTSKISQDLYYLSIPLAAKVPFSIKGLDFYGSAGGYAGMGLSGSADTITTFGDLEETNNGKIAWGSEQGVDNLKRFDYGLTFEAGIKYSAFQAGVFYNLGLANISADSEIGSVTKNRVFGISISYLFGASKKAEPVAASTTKVSDENSGAKSEKSKTEAQPKPKSKKAAALEAEKLRREQFTADSIAAVRAKEEQLRIEKARADSIEAARVTAIKLEEARLAKIKADSITAAQNAVVYRVQFASNSTKKGNYQITLGGKSYTTWEYFYSGAFRSTVGGFKTFAEAMQFQKTVRQSGYPQAFVVAFKNNVRTTDPALFK